MSQKPIKAWAVLDEEELFRNVEGYYSIFDTNQLKHTKKNIKLMAIKGVVPILICQLSHDLDNGKDSP